MQVFSVALTCRVLISKYLCIVVLQCTIACWLIYRGAVVECDEMYRFLANLNALHVLALHSQ